MRLLLTNGPFFSTMSANHLQSVGFGVDQFRDPRDVTEAMAIASYDLALLECTVAQDWTAWLKQCGKPITTGFIVLVAEDEARRLVGFEAGADDCLAHAVSGNELAARIRAILRRSPDTSGHVLQAGNLEMNRVSQQVSVNGAHLPLPPQELRIMELVLRKPGRIVTHRLLESDLYGACTAVSPNSVIARVSCLRRRLADGGANVTVINVRGIGYKLVEVELSCGPVPAGKQGMPVAITLPSRHAS